VKRIESPAFGPSSRPILPPTVSFVASDVCINPDRLLLSEGDFCCEFDGWLRDDRSSCVDHVVGIKSNQLLWAEGDSCCQFDGWLWGVKFGMAVDFRRISRFGSGLLELTSYLFD
jgi:hypothetical protein